MAIDITTLRKVFFVGIGGIGMSALARFFRHKGVQVSGYDLTATALTDTLFTEGIFISTEQDQLPETDTDLIIYTPAVKEHPVFRWANERGVQVLKRAEVLGSISRQYTTLAVAGTHGKTTTTAILAHLLQVAGFSPTAFVGGIMQGYGSNLLLGNGSYLVVEADEFDRSFLQLDVKHAIVTSIAPDHLDIYGSADVLEETYLRFAGQVHPKGSIWAHEEVSTRLADSAPASVYSYGYLEHVNNRLVISTLHALGGTFSIEGYWGSSGMLALNMGGRHNLLNAVAAYSLAREMGADPEKLREGMATFQGIDRRYTVHLQTDTCVLIDDYAHHPDEIEAAIGATRSALPGWYILAVFQPHLYSRTRDFARGFASALDLADEVFLAEIYPAREKPIEGVTSDIIYQQIHNTQKHKVTLDEVTVVVPSRLATLSTEKIAIVVMGAGNISNVVSPLRNALINLV